MIRAGGVPAARWGVLGPLVVRSEAGDDIRVPAGRQRTLLALLLMRANQPVPLDEIVDVLWDGAPPGDAGRAVRVYVARLRQVLGPGAAARLLTRDRGYQCEADGDELDLLRFEELCRRAGAASRDRSWVRAAGLLTEALGLWRGAPLADVSSEPLRARECPRLAQLRLQAVEDDIDARMHLRQHGQLIPRLRDLTEAEPLREHLHAQLVRALARGGRRAEALEAYRRVHRALADQLGIEPGPELRELHQRVLAGDEEPPAAVPVGGSIAPRQVPAGVRHFVGRAAELDRLTGLVTDPAAAGSVVIAQIVGTAGVGKTTLALNWAHLHAGRFPDGQLHADLRGFGPSGTPAAPVAVMRRFLAALDVPARQLPADPDELAALYRSRLAHRRVLVLLDNARDAELVRPLLPGAPGSLVLVTSRDQLRGLVARDGAIPLTLEPLTAAESRDLLVRRLGRDRLAGSERLADELVALCAGLPLALNIVAAHAALRPAHPLASLVDELRGDRLGALGTADGAADLRAAFSWSYRTLGHEAARVFRLLGPHPGADIGLAAATRLTGFGPERTRRALDELTAASLAREHAPGRYTLHELLRAYAAERGRSEDVRAFRFSMSIVELSRQRTV
jgi:DNA-binding SARP family transcriptional activator